MKSKLTFFLALIMMGCSNKVAQTTTNDTTENIVYSPIEMTWEMVANDVEPSVCECYFYLRNNSQDTLFGDWQIYYAHMSVQPMTLENEELHVEQIQASYHRLVPTELFQPIAPGEEHRYTMHYKGSMIRENHGPQGVFIKTADGNICSVKLTNIPFTNERQWKRGIETWEKTPYADGEYMYEYNARFAGAETRPTLSRRSIDEQISIFPMPKQVTYGEGTCKISKAVWVERTDANFMPQGYSMRITKDTIYVESSDSIGLFYAHKTIEKLDQKVIPQMTILDWPDLKHRGIMLDISRNYTTKENLKKLIDEMANYKLNILHLHICDDEAWRLEIPGYPQLTDFGSRRGYTETETDMLYPMYSGGWDATETYSSNNGYLTREDFIELLQFAKARYIKIIPEFDMPGHMRAAKKAMNGMLTDSVLEAREYCSAQHYTDNVIAVNLPFATEFVTHVIGEIKKMYEDAGCELDIFDIGGDEVPNGALTHEEHQAFIDSIYNYFTANNMRPMGWEEINHFMTPEQRPICHCWHAGNSKPQELIARGYDVILGSVSNLYLDMCYVNHHEEKGLYWGGYVDEYKTFLYEPLEDSHVIGMQGQFWAEMLRSYKQLEWSLFPKMFGLAERAWNNHSALTLQDYNAILWEYEVPQLTKKGINCHISQPGIHREGNMIKMNTAIPQAEIRYTTDGSEVTEKSPLYTGEFELTSSPDQPIRAKAFVFGLTSNCTWQYYPVND